MDPRGASRFPRVACPAGRDTRSGTPAAVRLRTVRSAWPDATSWVTIDLTGRPLAGLGGTTVQFSTSIGREKPGWGRTVATLSHEMTLRS